MKNYKILALLPAIAAIGSGCATAVSQSAFRPEDVAPSERTLSHKPYYVEDVFVIGYQGWSKYYEGVAEQRRKSLNMRINGALNGQDYAANATAFKNQLDDYYETAGSYAAQAFDVDEDDVTLPMRAFFLSLLTQRDNSDLAAMGLPDYDPGKALADLEANKTEEQKQREMVIAETSTQGAEAQLGAFGTAEGFNEQLQTAYPDLFAEGGTPIRVIVAIWNEASIQQGGAIMMIGTIMKGEFDKDYGVWIVQPGLCKNPKSSFPVPTGGFSVRGNTAVSFPFWMGGAKADDGKASVTSKSFMGHPKEQAEFINERLCAAIVDALNNLSDERFNEIVRK